MRGIRELNWYALDRLLKQARRYFYSFSGFVLVILMFRRDKHKNKILW